MSRIRSLTALAPVGILLTACGGGADAADAETPASETPASQSTESESSGGGAESSYQAGTYEADGDYQTPETMTHITVSMTIDDAGTVEAVEVTPGAEIGNSLIFQTKFADGIADVVVGKNLDDLEVTKVAGSSLSSGGFNVAIAMIKAQAQA